MPHINWNAVSAIATIGYLVASVFLWRAAWRAAKATEKQAQLTAEALRVASTQADTARQQIELVVAQLRPILVFLEPSISLRPDGHYRCTTKDKNQGKSVATDVRWRVQFAAAGNVIKLLPPSRRTELQPDEWAVIDETAAPVNPTVGPPRSVEDLSVHIEVQYASQLDPNVRHNMRHSECVLDFNIPTRKLSVATFSDNPVYVTKTAPSSGVPFP